MASTLGSSCIYLSSSSVVLKSFSSSCQLRADAKDLSSTIVKKEEEEEKSYTKVIQKACLLIHTKVILLIVCLLYG